MFAHTRFLTVFAMVAAASLALAGCERQISPGVYEGARVGTSVQTLTGTVQSARVVIVQEDELLQDNTVGGAVGGLAGGLVGSALTHGSGVGAIAATAGGALAGAAIGAMGQRTLQRQDAMEYIVRLDDGRLVTIVQGMQPQIPVGRRVYVQTGSSGDARVLPAG